ncbi:MAG: hypothetical protein Q8M29_14255 [Bacteroidota bacterium]|nr:hypothetical protein [Bacteroidota bacterium]
MKIKNQIFLFVLTILFVASCKKGEEDPTFSFRTRKNRVVGDWKLKSGKSTYEETGSNGAVSYSDGFIYSESGYTYTTGTGWSTQVYAGSHSYKLEFSKDGTVASTETLDGQAITNKGLWDFNVGVGEVKAKEEINVRYESVQNSNGTKTYKGNQMSMTYSILELRNKKMKLRAEYNVKNPDGTGYKYIDYYELVQ